MQYHPSSRKTLDTFYWFNEKVYFQCLVAKYLGFITCFTYPFLCALTKYLTVFKISFCIYEYLEIFNLKKNLRNK